MDDGGYADCAGLRVGKKPKEMTASELVKHRKSQEFREFITMGICAVVGVSACIGLFKQENANPVEQPSISSTSIVQANILKIRSQTLNFKASVEQVRKLN